MKKYFLIAMLLILLPFFAYAGPIGDSGGIQGGGSVSNTAYDATSWNGINAVAPSKNAVRDKIESMSSAAAITGGTITGITDLAVADGGTGASTLADGGIVVGNGTSAVEVVAPGATTTILVGGGAATNPVWTTATGTGAPVRAGSPIIVTPAIDTINESTGGAGVTIDSVLLKDGYVNASAYVVTQAATDTLTAAECKNSVISNYGQAAENTQTLPAAAAGLKGMVSIAATGVGAFHLKAGAGDKIYLNGTAMADGEKVTLAAPAIGDCATFWTIQTGAAAWDWVFVSGVGLWISGGA